MQELHSQLNEIFKEPSTGLEAKPLRSDFRKVSAKYVCSGKGREFLCVRFSETQSGKCKYQTSENFCENY